MHRSDMHMLQVYCTPYVCSAPSGMTSTDQSQGTTQRPITVIFITLTVVIVLVLLLSAAVVAVIIVMAVKLRQRKSPSEYYCRVLCEHLCMQWSTSHHASYMVLCSASTSLSSFTCTMGHHS